ncbi:hypothetical protein ALP79_200224 [Pseudomonas savastanoi pv. fraxini]|nr:hypothetical protein ALP79_200224 [Pseudomonas savastanoi pv. fraxini]
MSIQAIAAAAPKAASLAAKIASTHPALTVAVTGVTVVTVAVSGIWIASHYGRKFSFKCGPLSASVTP